ncbi:SubName: Full=Uncharacterized protein {ECO:0000313/EMBL:CCA75124.1} [Serendipita indica DSM 11827]|uniref:Uncharacterized protein n=1 Tax=Serendipita indica (strain DSM 11827) TaxID=1109443 RepID=G4TUY1_SERID|nr:SubName: Full=Uncharacterized protein {ECO:0000313/EMBL:CCA75124.1} [Serendipita indica DSM 11827]CCA75124.1 hypothetical protein PIIN_09108 [Serendipita indica DSM 11827]
MFYWMPSKANIATATASNTLYKPAKRPVGLFFGGTSGIGQAMAEQFARQTNGRAQIVLLGRNEQAARAIIDGFPKTDSSTPEEDSSKYSFIKVDATSMAQVREVTAKLLNELEKVNYIVATAGFVTLKGRDETSEGIDKKLACHFYARFRFIYDLMPLVDKAANDGEETGVISVLAAGTGQQVELDDLGLVKRYNLGKAAGHAATYNDAMIINLALTHPKTRFYHAFPGLVDTPIMKSFPSINFLYPVLKFLTKPLLIFYGGGCGRRKLRGQPVITRSIIEGKKSHIIDTRRKKP